WAEAIAIRGERIFAVGSTNDIRELADADTKVVNLLGRTVVPGINDAHVHAPGDIGEHVVPIPSTASVDDVLALVGAAAKQQPAGAWLTGELPIGILDDPRLSRDALDAVAPAHPVRLSNLAGHSDLLNSLGLRQWNIGDTDADPPGGHYGRTAGRLNGWVYEHAIWSKRAEQVAKAKDEVLIDSVRRFSDEMLRYGVTSVQSMPILPLERLTPIMARATVPLRFRLIEFQMARVEENPAGPVKYILDGTPIERGAAMSTPYSDRPAERGRVNYSDEDLRRIVDAAARSPHPVLLHVAGDVALGKLFAAMRANGADWTAKRVRVEHGDFIARHADEARALGIVLVQNPAHFMIPQLMEARLGADRMKDYQAFRSIAERGIPVAIGSDGPLNPWLNVLFATIHPRNPAEAMTREQAVRAYTAGSAYAEFAEKQKGTIAPGMLADLAILSQDVFTVPPPELPKTESVMTMIGGKVVYGSLDGL
ncbi:MAG TPA: amidohydrolase family protein, partial [Thermoanaerobaculia bacterium]|nr:amidohydrolase family protein [Thermoanaerobaculia bacterium]